ncbi:MAG: hypothetical protein ACRDLD_14945 [Thermoleophilaceae bacterium]
MSEKVSPALREELESAQEEGRELPVIVTLVEGADAAGLVDREGTELRSISETIPAVAGTLTPEQVRELARLEQVELIELDGEMRAL